MLHEMKNFREIFFVRAMNKVYRRGYKSRKLSFILE